ncbi:MAG: hypothetical protein AAF799_08155 [Myxococcota bacterium]
MNAAALDVVRRAVARGDYFRGSAAHLGAKAGHKEWMHFAVYAPGLDLLVNYSVVDDVRSNAKEAPSLARLVYIARTDRWQGEVEQVSRATLGLGRIEARFDQSTLTFDGHEYHLEVRPRRGWLEADLRLEPVTVPSLIQNVDVGDGPPIHWLVVPRLHASGWVRVHDRKFELDRAPAYHDHNWGSFRWGRDFAWEWGFGLPPRADNPWSSVFVRLSDRGLTHTLMQGLFLWKGVREQRVFRGHELRITREGLLRADRVCKLPGAMGLLSPGTATDVPQRLRLRAEGRGDRVDAVFTSAEIAQVIIPNDDDDGVTIINEVAGRFELEGRVRGEAVAIEGPAVFEFLGR